MSYDLTPTNSDGASFHFGALSFGHLLEACGYLWPCIHSRGGKWFCVFGVDDRMPTGDMYPAILTNDGFPVTSEEARIMARIARNYAAIQNEIKDQKYSEDDWLLPCSQQQWPVRVRDDWTRKFLLFADWAKQSGGFTIN